MLELSSFQIDLMPSLKPDAGVLLTNITPDHLDRHGTMEDYAAVKARMFASQGRDDTAIIGVDDEWGEAIAAAAEDRSRVVPVSVERTLADGVSARDGILRQRTAQREVASIDLRSMPALKGTHNWQNACMAYAAARALGLSPQEIEAGMASFPGLAHRMQEVGQLDGDRLHQRQQGDQCRCGRQGARLLRSHLLDRRRHRQGGRHRAAADVLSEDRDEPISSARPRRNSPHTHRRQAHPVEICGTLDRAVAAAARDAVPAKSNGAVVLLSPACASFDHYPEFRSARRCLSQRRWRHCRASKPAEEGTSC